MKADANDEHPGRAGLRRHHRRLGLKALHLRHVPATSKKIRGARLHTMDLTIGHRVEGQPDTAEQPAEHLVIGANEWIPGEGIEPTPENVPAEYFDVGKEETS